MNTPRSMTRAFPIHGDPLLKTAVITGVSSFVGCHLATTFAANGYRVVATTTRRVGDYDGIRAARLARVAAIADMVQLDIEDAAAIKTLVDKVRPDVWVHHAGYADKYHALDHDFERSVAVNVLPLAGLYAALAPTKTPIIITGSSGEYADGDAADTENDTGEPVLPYGRAKLMETEEAHRLAELHGVPTRVARLYIPFGDLDNPQKLLSQVVAHLKSGQAVDLSPCEQRRDFIAVEDVCRAYLLLVNDMARQTFDVFNICSGEAVTLRTLLEGIADALGADPALLQFGAIAMRAGEAPVSYGSNEKARTVLNWQPQPLADAIHAYIEQDNAHEHPRNHPHRPA